MHSKFQRSESENESSRGSRRFCHAETPRKTNTTAAAEKVCMKARTISLQAFEISDFFPHRRALLTVDYFTSPAGEFSPHFLLEVSLLAGCSFWCKFRRNSQNCCLFYTVAVLCKYAGSDKTCSMFFFCNQQFYVIQICFNGLASVTEYFVLYKAFFLIIASVYFLITCLFMIICLYF